MADQKELLEALQEIGRSVWELRDRKHWGLGEITLEDFDKILEHPVLPVLLQVGCPICEALENEQPCLTEE